MVKRSRCFELLVRERDKLSTKIPTRQECLAHLQVAHTAAKGAISVADNYAGANTLNVSFCAGPNDRTSSSFGDF
jgi:hypothetical protein